MRRVAPGKRRKEYVLIKCIIRLIVHGMSQVIAASVTTNEGSQLKPQIQNLKVRPEALRPPARVLLRLHSTCVPTPFAAAQPIIVCVWWQSATVQPCLSLCVPTGCHREAAHLEGSAAWTVPGTCWLQRQTPSRTRDPGRQFSLLRRTRNPL